jgi:hypothetical protein
VSFEVFLQGHPTKTDHLPPVSAIENVFSDRILRTDPRFGSLTLATEDDRTELYFHRRGHVVDHVLVSRPTTSLWLWDALYGLLSDYDMFRCWPGERLVAAVARPDVPLPDGMAAEPAVVASGTDLRTLVEAG